jgi:nitrite reductase/ring-hydroxylating ferredoxin subunit
MADWTDVGSVDEFASGSLVAVSVGVREVCILNTGEDLFAVRNVCPHAGARMCAGRILSKLTADQPEPAAFRRVEGEDVLACPWHGWEFDPRDGRAVADPGMRLKTWPVRIDDSRVLVRI